MIPMRDCFMDRLVDLEEQKLGAEGSNERNVSFMDTPSHNRHHFTALA